MFTVKYDISPLNIEGNWTVDLKYVFRIILVGCLTSLVGPNGENDAVTCFPCVNSQQFAMNQRCVNGPIWPL